MKYLDIRDHFDNLDVVLFHGTGFISDLVGLFSKHYTHVGTVVRCSAKDLDILLSKNLISNTLSADCRGKSDVLMLFESTVINGKKGVQLNLLSESIAKYKGKVAVRHLDTDRRLNVKNYYKFISESLGKPYESHPLELLGCAVESGISIEDDSDFFCSELSARSYQKVKLLPPQPIANKYKPDDFMYGGVVDSRLINATLELEIVVDKG